MGSLLIWDEENRVFLMKKMARYSSKNNIECFMFHLSAFHAE
jgi:hypothetical protein